VPAAAHVDPGADAPRIFPGTFQPYLQIMVAGGMLCIVAVDKSIVVDIADDAYIGPNNYIKNNNFAKAQKYINEVLKKDKHFFEAYHDLGIIYAIKKQKLEALKYFDKAIKENSKYYSAYVHRANIYYDLGKKEEASKDFATVISQKPNYVMAYEKRGFIYYSDKDYSKALSDFDNAEKYKSNNAMVYFKRAEIYRQRNEIDKAISDYTKCISKQPDYLEAVIKRGELYYQKKEYEHAIEDLKKAKIQNDTKKVNTIIAHSYYQIHNTDKAISAYSDVVTRFRSRDWDVYYNRGLLYLEKKEYLKAKNDFSKSIAYKKDNLSLHHQDKTYSLLTF